MRLKVPFFRFALALIGFLAPLVIFAALLPSLINAEPVKKRFVEELKSLTAAQVELAGPVAIESFFSLSLQAEDVKFKAFRKAPGLKDVRAARIVARISWIDLLSGNLDFDKIKIDNAVFSLRPMGKEEMTVALKSLLTAPRETPFAALVLSNSKIKMAGDKTIEAREADISWLVVKVHNSKGRVDLDGHLTWRGEDINLSILNHAASSFEGTLLVPLQGNVASKHLTGQFKGELIFGKEDAVTGQIEADTPNASALFNWLGWSAGFNIAAPVRISATLNASEKGVQLQSGAFSAAGEEASGDLNIALSGGARIEGALAFDHLDMEKFWAAGSGHQQDHPDGGRLAQILGRQNVDLRISANEARWKTLPLGTAAFTLTGWGGTISSEIARLDFAGGTIFGHVEADFRDILPKIKGRVTAEETDAAKLAAMLMEAGSLTGRMDANVEFQAQGWTASQLIKSVTAELKADFPEGGQMQLDLSELVQSASAGGQDGWSSSALSWWAFDDLRFKLLLEKDHLRFADLILRGANEDIRGSGEIDLRERYLNWQLKVVSGGDKSVLDGTINKELIPETSLFIQGPWAKPSIRLSSPSSGSIPTFASPLPRAPLQMLESKNH